MSARDEAAMQALSDAGAQCGTCGDEPGDRICPDCERHYQWCVDALRKAGWAPRAEVLLEAADRFDREIDDNEILRGDCPGAMLRDWASSSSGPAAGDKQPETEATQPPCLNCDGPVRDSGECPNCDAEEAQS